MATKAFYRRLISHFPQKQMRYAFAYGSGVFQQTGHSDMSKNMIDFIFAVDDPKQWHEENMAQNPSHYSFLRWVGPSQVSNLQENLGARIYFNTLVPVGERLIKYGVISTAALTNDLLDWETLYVSGRLHKPVFPVLRKEGPPLDMALQSNLQSAMHTALLILPDEFSELELYTTITGLSYSGDIRMRIGEDKNKVRNIVEPNIERFRDIYEPILDKESHLHFNKSLHVLEQSLSPVTRYHHLNLLPKYLLYALVDEQNKDGRNRDTEEVIRKLAHDSDCSYFVEQCVSSIVEKSSTSQSLKGLLTAGLVKSYKYSLAKLRKMWRSQSK